MNAEIEDAIFSACGVTTEIRSQYGKQSPTPKAVENFTYKLKEFLREIDGTLTVTEVLDELEN